MEQKICTWLSQLTLEEKACLVGGHKSWHTVAIPRLGIPSVFLTDGPHGLRKKREESKEIGLGTTEPATAFPTAATTASSWNPSLVAEMGEAMGKECNHYGVHVILGPAVNIKRNPLCGRSFEYFSEDPLISGAMGAALVRGIESRGVAASVKHYACNNNENNRYFGDSIVDERALREIYLRGFERIVKTARPATLMCAYNKVNGEYASENRRLLTEIPREEWGFDGLIMSDWGAVNDRVAGLIAGLDLEMPGDIAHNRQAIVDAVREGRLSEETLDIAVRRVLRLVCTVLQNKKDENVPPFEENSTLACRIATESAVLLKNQDGTLPLAPDGEYLVVGELFEKMRYQGAGSSLLNPWKLITPRDAFVSEGIRFHYEKGYEAACFTPDDRLEALALEKAKAATTVLFFGGLTEDAESEGFDRAHMLLPENQRRLLGKLIAAGKTVVVVLYGGSPVELHEAEGAAAILHMYLPGQEGGRATASLLFGKVSPSGRLSETWPLLYSDVPFHEEFTKTTNDIYKESVFVGYRYYTTYDIPVRYPFGYGLSYTSFGYRDFTVIDEGDCLAARVFVKNTGATAGQETVQLYADPPQSAFLKPTRALVAFVKVSLAPGEEREVTLRIPKADLEVYTENGWVLEAGDYTLHVAKDVETPILSAVLALDGVSLSSPDAVRAAYKTKDALLSMTDEDYARVFGREILPQRTVRPYDLNTPMRDYKTAGGRFLLGAIRLGCRFARFVISLAKDSDEKQTKLKNMDFAAAAILTMSLRSMSYASEGALSHRRAEGLLSIANNRPLRGLWRLISPERAPKLPPQT